ncbi:MAG: acyl-CoA thioesterase II [Streptomycetaceae bacterium]|nr:acyl-CoA thioesterase II [Streptomycetaceae bacterium]
MEPDATPLTHLLGLLDVHEHEQQDQDSGHGTADEAARLRGYAPAEGTAPVYGGHLVAQALGAAGRTADPRYHVHSLHASFLRPAEPGQPLDYTVERVTDTLHFATRHVRGRQQGREVFQLTASLHRPEPGPVYQQLPMPDVPGPDSLPTHEERLSKALGQHVEPLGKPYDLRFVGPLSFEAAGDPALRSARNQVWVRADGSLPPEPVPGHDHLLHACLLGYLSDVTLLDTAMMCHGLNWLTDLARVASLDHAVWFHRPARVDQWLLYEQDAAVTYGARTLVHGRFFTRDGIVVASVAQEVLLRVAPRT